MISQTRDEWFCTDVCDVSATEQYETCDACKQEVLARHGSAVVLDAESGDEGWKCFECIEEAGDDSPGVEYDPEDMGETDDSYALESAFGPND